MRKIHLWRSFPEDIWLPHRSPSSSRHNLSRAEQWWMEVLSGIPISNLLLKDAERWLREMKILSWMSSSAAILSSNQSMQQETQLRISWDHGMSVDITVILEMWENFAVLFQTFPIDISSKQVSLLLQAYSFWTSPLLSSGLWLTQERKMQWLLLPQHNQENHLRSLMIGLILPNLRLIIPYLHTISMLATVRRLKDKKLSDR